VVRICIGVILNFYLSTKNVLLTSGCIYYTFWYHFSLTNNVNFVDVLSRIDTTEFFLNSYYYLWTSFWYIPTLLTFISSVKLEFVLTKVAVLRHTHIYLAMIVGVVTLELGDYWYLNTHHITYTIDSLAVNPLLTNSINKYHPLLFYISVLGLVVVCVYTNSLRRYRTDYFTFSSVVRYVISYSTQYLIYYITVTLFWGSWWALQEGSWGGWWNWDPSEVFGLVVMVFILVTSHTTHTYNTVHGLFVRLLMQVTTLLLLYLFIQLNFSLVSHNFGIKTTQFVNPIQWFSILTVYICLLLSRFVIVRSRLRDHNILSWKRGVLGYAQPKHAIIGCLGVLICAEVVYSFYPLINDFLWKLLNLNTLNNSVRIQSIITYNIVILFMGVWSPISSTTYLAYLVIVSGSGLLLPLLILTSTLRRSSINLSHYLIVVFLYTTLVYAQRNGVYWDLGTTAGMGSGFGAVLTRSLTILSKLSNVLCSESLIISGGILSTLTNFGLFKTSTTPENPIFALTVGWIDSCQVLIDGLFTTLFLVNVADYGIGQLTSLLIWVLTLTYCWLNRYEKIMY